MHLSQSCGLKNIINGYMSDPEHIQNVKGKYFYGVRSAVQILESKNIDKGAMHQEIIRKEEIRFFRLHNPKIAAILGS